MTPAKLAELEEKAKSATPGERLSVEKSINGMPSNEFTWINPDGSVWLSRDVKTDSEFHAAANPATILELIAAYRKAVEALKLSHKCHENLYLAHWGHAGLTPDGDIPYREVSATLKELGVGE